MHNLGNVLVTEILMPRFYFNLASTDAHISDDSGKELDTLNDTYEHAGKLIYKICFTLAVRKRKHGRLLFRTMIMMLR